MMIPTQSSRLTLYSPYDIATECLKLDTSYAIAKKKALNNTLPLLEYPEQNGVVKERNAVLLLSLLERCFQLLSFHYHFGLKQLQPHAILKADQSSFRLMERWRITSLMTGNLQ
ncbi:hypothetical protein Tco_0264843 [Tanacetum coccineum]